MTDSAYQPARIFCDATLKRMGVETTYYDPLVGAGIAALMRANTKAVFVEAPGSQSLEVQDIPAIAAAAHARGACVIADNTWATPLFFSPHAHGVDMAVEAGTKYLSGHSDLLARPRLGQRAMVSAPAPRPSIRWRSRPVPRTCFSRCAACARWSCGFAKPSARRSRSRIGSKARPEVLRVIHPALPDDPGHAIWKRDFSGSSGLFSVVLKPASEAAVAAMLDGLELFGMGYSWGGYESLVIPFDCASYRTATRWAPGGPTLRFSVGLEDIEDLKEDLDRGFARLAAASERDAEPCARFSSTPTPPPTTPSRSSWRLRRRTFASAALTTVAGNVGLEQATRNALITAEIAGSDVPVFKGAARR